MGQVWRDIPHRPSQVVFLFSDRRDVVQSAFGCFDTFQAGDHPAREISRREAPAGRGAAGGRERTAAEYRDLLRQAGFRMTRVVQTASPFRIVQARPVEESLVKISVPKWRKDSAMLARAALDIIRDYRTCEFTTLFRDGSPQTWPVSA